MPWTEKDRFLNLQTPLGDDKFLLRSFSGYEAISQPFHFHLDMLSEDSSIGFDDMMGKNVGFSVRLADTSKARYFNGYVSRFEQLPGEERLTRYHAEIVPWLWFLTLSADCRVFQNKTVPDIVKAVFDELGFTDYEQQLNGQYDPWDYCVQYRESAFNFVSRLLEQEGIFYFFKHENGKHTMVLADSPSAHQPCPDQARVMFERTTGRGALREEDVVYSWRNANVMRTGKFAFTDYNFETPGTNLHAEVASQINQGGNQKYEVYDYPGEYEKRGEGDSWAKRRIEEEEAGHAPIEGESDCRALFSGFKFELFGHERRDQNGSYVLTSVTHQGEEGGFYSGAGSESESTYSNTFTAMAAATPYRPPRLTPKHLVNGVQTAVVVGPSGEEIYCDKYGRVKVQFHWDRRGTQDEKSSCWVRAAQPWAGNGWGAMMIPRIGQEVVVSFLEGDPDRPLITGNVYNAQQTAPYQLPGKMTTSTIRSSSSKGGGNSNELRFDDTKSKEQIFVHGAYDHDMLVDHDRKETIGNESHHLIKGDHFERSKKDRHVYVDQNLNQKVGSTLSLNIGTNKQEKVGQNWAMNAGMEIHLKAGMNLVIESGTTLTLKVGGNFVNINSGGIFIKGSMVMINSGGAAGSGAGSSPTAPTDPKEVSPGAPTQAAPPPAPPKPPKPQRFSPSSAVLKQAAAQGTALCEICPKCSR